MGVVSKGFGVSVDEMGEDNGVSVGDARGNVRVGETNGVSVSDACGDIRVAVLLAGEAFTVAVVCSLKLAPVSFSAGPVSASVDACGVLWIWNGAPHELRISNRAKIIALI